MHRSRKSIVEMNLSGVIPGRGLKAREPGIQKQSSEGLTGFRVRAFHARPGMTKPKGMSGVSVALSIVVAVAITNPAHAQDVRGLEVCTAEKQMERRTSCLQANIDFLQNVIDRNARDARLKLDAATKELAAARNEVAALKASLAALQARLEKLEKPEKNEKPKTNGK